MEKKMHVLNRKVLKGKSDKALAFAKLVHDLKGPLNSIKGLLNIALREIDHAERNAISPLLNTTSNYCITESMNY